MFEIHIMRYLISNHEKKGSGFRKILNYMIFFEPFNF